MDLICPKCGFTPSVQTDEVGYCHKCGTKLIEKQDKSSANEKTQVSGVSIGETCLKVRDNMWNSVIDEWKDANTGLKNGKQNNWLTLAIVVGAIACIFIVAVIYTNENTNTPVAASASKPNLQDNEKQYQQGIEQINNSNFDDAVLSLNDLSQEGYKDAKVLYAYAEAKKDYQNKDMDLVETFVDDIPDDYKGIMAETILGFKKQLQPEIASYQEEQLKANADLEVLSWNWTYSDSFVNATGEVKNNSNQNLDDVEALVSFYASDKTFITSADALIDYNPILPGQVSPFHVITTYNPEMNNASLEFKTLMGGSLKVYIDNK